MTNIAPLLLALASSFTGFLAAYLIGRREHHSARTLLVRKPDGKVEELEAPLDYTREAIRNRVIEAMKFENDIGEMLDAVAAETGNARQQHSPANGPDFVLRNAAGNIGVEVKMKLTERSAIEKYLGPTSDFAKLILVLGESPDLNSQLRLQPLLDAGRLSILVAKDSASVKQQLRNALASAP